MKSLQQSNKRIFALYAAAFVTVLAAVLLGLLLGSSDTSAFDMISAIISGDSRSPEYRIFAYVRLPRALASLLCGAALSLSGAVIQGVLANRLASPSIIGVNAGAGLAVTLCSCFGIVGGWQLSLFAFIGAFAVILPVSIGVKKWGASRGTVILTGVALSALLGAASDAISVFFPHVAAQSVDFKVGDFSSVTYAKLIPAAVAITLASALLFTLSNDLEIISLGDEAARALGLNVGASRVIFLVLAALLAGVSVSIAGLLSFVGLLVPAAVRRLSGGTRHLLPLCALFGAGFVSLCDTFARTVFSPYEIPVGIIMAFIGAPFFIFILIKGKEDRQNA